MATIQLLIESDVLADYLTCEDSLVRDALRHCRCYTTMVNAMELFRAAQSDEEQDAVFRMFNVIRVLGFNARQAKPFAQLARECEQARAITLSSRETMILGMAQASNLEILTKVFFDRYTTTGLVPIHQTVPQPNGQRSTTYVTPLVTQQSGLPSDALASGTIRTAAKPQNSFA